MNLHDKPVYHILYAYNDGDTADPDYVVKAIPVDTLEGVYANLAKREMHPVAVQVIYGTAVALDRDRALEWQRKQYRQWLDKQEAAERAQYERLKKKYGDGA